MALKILLSLLSFATIQSVALAQQAPISLKYACSGRGIYSHIKAGGATTLEAPVMVPGPVQFNININQDLDQFIILNAKPVGSSWVFEVKVRQKDANGVPAYFGTKLNGGYGELVYYTGAFNETGRLYCRAQILP